jgi:hypothetical protein
LRTRGRRGFGMGTTGAAGFGAAAVADVAVTREVACDDNRRSRMARSRP